MFLFLIRVSEDARVCWEPQAEYVGVCPYDLCYLSGGLIEKERLLSALLGIKKDLCVLCGARPSGQSSHQDCPTHEEVLSQLSHERKDQRFSR